MTKWKENLNKSKGGDWISKTDEQAHCRGAQHRLKLQQSSHSILYSLLPPTHTHIPHSLLYLTHSLYLWPGYFQKQNYCTEEYFASKHFLSLPFWIPLPRDWLCILPEGNGGWCRVRVRSWSRQEQRGYETRVNRAGSRPPLWLMPRSDPEEWGAPRAPWWLTGCVRS